MYSRNTGFVASSVADETLPFLLRSFDGRDLFNVAAGVFFFLAISGALRKFADQWTINLVYSGAGA